ncbi:MAG: PAS domain S-box protein, partial [Chloroflexota bacterium]
MDSNPAPNMLPTDPGVNFHALADYAFLGMVCLRPSGEILYANLAAARLLELPGPHDLVGRSVQQIAGKPGQWDVFLAALAEPGAVRELELELQTARGRTRVCLCSAHHLNGTISATLLDITDRLRMGKELRKLSRVVSQMADMVVITDQQGIIEYVNRSFELITGYTQDEALGSSISLLESGRHTPQFYRQMWDTILGGKVFQADVINRRKNGELFYQNQTMTPIRDGVRGITNFVITGKDITERKRASEMLEKSQASLENAQSIAHLGNWELDFTAGPGDWSQEMYHLFGCDPAAGPPTYAAFLALIHPDDLPAMLAAERAAQEQDAWVTVEFRTAPERGEPRYFQGTLHAVRDAAGGVVGMTGTTLEITALKLAQLELETLNRELEQRVDERTAEVRRQEATYRALFENSHDGIFLFSPDGRLLQANPQALALVGYSLDEYRALIAEHPQAAAPSERLRQAQASFQAALQGEIVPLFETTLTRKDGQKVDIEINLSMVRGADGQAALVQSVVRDITLRKVSEAALKESRDNLRAANATLQHAARLKDEFL